MHNSDGNSQNDGRQEVARGYDSRPAVESITGNSERLAIFAFLVMDLLAFLVFACGWYPSTADRPEAFNNEPIETCGQP